MLEIRNIDVEIDNNGNFLRILDNVSLKIIPGEITGLIGESGSGKTILGLSVMNLLNMKNARISQGKILLDNDDITALPEKKSRSITGNRIAMIFQEPLASLNPVMPIFKQLTEPLINHRNLSYDDSLDILFPLLKDMGINNPQNRVSDYPFQFSGGQLQRMCIASAISTSPDYLIADEPTTALDPTIQKDVVSIIMSLAKNKKMGVLFITHDLPLISQFADSIAVIYAGRLMETGNADKIINEAEHPYTRALIESVSYPEEWCLMKSIEWKE